VQIFQLISGAKKRQNIRSLAYFDARHVSDASEYELAAIRAYQSTRLPAALTAFT